VPGQVAQDAHARHLQDVADLVHLEPGPALSELRVLLDRTRAMLWRLGRV